MQCTCSNEKQLIDMFHCHIECGCGLSEELCMRGLANLAILNNVGAIGMGMRKERAERLACELRSGRAKCEDGAGIVCRGGSLHRWQGGDGK